MSALGDSEYKCTLSDEALEKAKKELNEDPNTRLVEVKNLRARVEKIPGLKAKVNFKFLLAFLRAKKFEQERAFQLVKHYYEAKRDNPDIFDDLKPSRIRHVFEDGLLEVLEHRDNNGCRVVIIRPGRWDPDRYSMLEIPKALFVVLSKILEEEENQVHGVHFINNLENIGWKQASHVTPAFAKRITSIIQEVLPLRLKKLDYVNEPTFFDVIFAIVKQFMKEKLVNRITLHGANFEKLHATINPDYLPTDLGGKTPMFQNQAFIDDLLASDAMFEEGNKYGYVNMKVSKSEKVSRSGDAGVEGLGGTFKKLDI